MDDIKLISIDEFKKLVAYKDSINYDDDGDDGDDSDDSDGYDHKGKMYHNGIKKSSHVFGVEFWSNQTKFYDSIKSDERICCLFEIDKDDSYLKKKFNIRRKKTGYLCVTTHGKIYMDMTDSIKNGSFGSSIKINHKIRYDDLNFRVSPDDVKLLLSLNKAHKFQGQYGPKILSFVYSMLTHMKERTLS